MYTSCLSCAHYPREVAPAACPQCKQLTDALLAQALCFPAALPTSHSFKLLCTVLLRYSLCCQGCGGECSVEHPLANVATFRSVSLALRAQTMRIVHHVCVSCCWTKSQTISCKSVGCLHKILLTKHVSGGFGRCQRCCTPGVSSSMRLPVGVIGSRSELRSKTQITCHGWNAHATI